LLFELNFETKLRFLDPDETKCRFNSKDSIIKTYLENSNMS